MTYGGGFGGFPQKPNLKFRVPNCHHLILRHLHHNLIAVYIQTNEAHAYEMHAHEMYAHEVHAYNVHANEVHAHEVHAHEGFCEDLARQTTFTHLSQLQLGFRRCRILVLCCRIWVSVTVVAS
jgi:hypothetical protein